MKNLALFCSLGLLLCAACSKDEEPFIIDENTVVRFDDPAFEAQCLLNYDDDNDHVLTVRDITFVRVLSVDTREIASLGGIEYFINLEQLICVPYGSDNPEPGLLERLDVSRNRNLRLLSCAKNRLKRLDVSRNRELEQLYCSGNQLEVLVLKSPVLYNVDCSDNRLKQLDLRSCSSALRQCFCKGNPRGMKLRLMWYQAPYFRYDPTVDIYDKRIDGDKILTFADPEFERQVIVSKSESSYYGIDFNGDGKVSRNEAAYIRDQDFLCDGITSLRDMRYLCNLTSCTLRAGDPATCRLRSLDGIYDLPEINALRIVDLPITTLNTAKFKELRSLDITGTNLESLDLSRVTWVGVVLCDQCMSLKEIWLKNRDQLRALYVYCDDHTRIRYRENN